jgi:hypothetical protein
MIVGADGPRSKVRELMLGAEQGATTSMDLIMCNNTFCYNDAEKARFVRKRSHPICCTAMHPEMYIFLGGTSDSSTFTTINNIDTPLSLIQFKMSQILMSPLPGAFTSA